MRSTPGRPADSSRGVPGRASANQHVSQLGLRTAVKSAGVYHKPSNQGHQEGRWKETRQKQAHDALCVLNVCHTCQHMHAHGSSEPLVWVTEELDRHLGQRSARMSKPI